MKLYSMVAAVVAAGGMMLASPAESQAHNRGTPFGVNVGVGNLHFSYGSGFGFGVPARGFAQPVFVPAHRPVFAPSYVAPRPFIPGTGIYPQPYFGPRQGTISPRQMYQAPRGPFWR